MKAASETDYLLVNNRRNDNQEHHHQQRRDEEFYSDGMHRDHHNETISNSSYQRSTKRHFSNPVLIIFFSLALIGLFVTGWWDAILTTKFNWGPPTAMEIFWSGSAHEPSWWKTAHHANELHRHHPVAPSSSDAFSGGGQSIYHTNSAPSVPNSAGDNAAASSDWQNGGGGHSPGGWHDVWHQNHRGSPDDSENQYRGNNKKADKHQYHEWKKETEKARKGHFFPKHAVQNDSTNPGINKTIHASSYETWSVTDVNGTTTHYQNWTDNNGDIHYQEWTVIDPELTSNTTTYHHHYYADGTMTEDDDFL